MGVRKPSAALCHCGDHAFAAATKGVVVLVSPQDTHVLLESCWKTHVNRRWKRVYWTIMSSGGAHILSRRVLDAEKGVLVDHVNRDTADCRRQNLRLSTPSQNQANRAGTAHRDLPKGVVQRGSRFTASITHRGEWINLGSYETVEAAARAYASAAIALNGQFARFG